MNANTHEARVQLERYQHYLEQDAGNSKLLADIADLHLQLGEIDKAYACSTRALQNAPADPVLRFRHATVAMAGGHFSEAIENYQNLKLQGKQGDVLRFNLAYAYAYNRQFDKAMEELDVIRQPEVLPRYRMLKALVLHHLGDYEQAIVLLREQLQHYPEDDNVLADLSLLLVDTGDHFQARLCAEAALQLNPGNARAYTSLGLLALAEEDETQSLYYLQQAAMHDPKSGRALSGLGLAQLLNHDLVSATLSLEQAVQTMPNHLGTWHALAWCYLLQNRVQEAEGSFQSAMALDRNFAENHGGLAVIDILNGHPDSAQLRIKRALRIDKNAFSALYASSMLQQAQGKPEQAKQLIIHILEETGRGGSEKIRNILFKLQNKKHRT